MGCCKKAEKAEGACCENKECCEKADSCAAKADSCVAEVEPVAEDTAAVDSVVAEAAEEVVAE
ncbi:MAG TPA: hypothetical protein DIW30_07400 [Bacteroidales bacterium]|nr:hypothetical protein [Bacteroidales bacterium]